MKKVLDSMKGINTEDVDEDLKFKGDEDSEEEQVFIGPQLNSTPTENTDSDIKSYETESQKVTAKIETIDTPKPFQELSPPTAPSTTPTEPIDEQVSSSILEQSFNPRTNYVKLLKKETSSSKSSGSKKRKASKSKAIAASRKKMRKGKKGH
uniref:Uncharacterized protein n=1 Tax=Arcella intermedia TaxID=1963864 RepID=A0A6B2LJ38_9EUKA